MLVAQGPSSAGKPSVDFLPLLSASAPFCQEGLHPGRCALSPRLQCTCPVAPAMHQCPDPMRVVFDTSVLVAAMHSSRGASFALLSSIPSSRFQLCLSVPLYLEWQDVLTRPEHLPPGRSAQDALAALRGLAASAHLQEIHYLWRPFLGDANDDMVLELALAAGCHCIVTHNVRDFTGAEPWSFVLGA